MSEVTKVTKVYICQSFYEPNMVSYVKKDQKDIDKEYERLETEARSKFPNALIDHRFADEETLADLGDSIQRIGEQDKDKTIILLSDDYFYDKFGRMIQLCAETYGIPYCSEFTMNKMM